MNSEFMNTVMTWFHEWLGVNSRFVKKDFTVGDCKE